MASDEAWQAGVDIATGAKDKKKKKYTGMSKKKMGGKDDSSGEKTASGNPYSILSYLPKLHHGGKVKKTGNYRLRKKEVVLTVAQQKKAGLLKKGGKKTARKRVAGK
jgi:hypothetical protein